MKKILISGVFFLLFNFGYSVTSIKEGTDYSVINSSIKLKKSKEPVDIKEFFSFTCIHCKDLEPLLEQYVSQNRKAVRLTQVHVVWNDDPNIKNLAKLDATLQIMGLKSLYLPVFSAIFNQQNLTNLTVLNDFLKKNNLDAKTIKKFDNTYNSFEVSTMVGNYKTMTLDPRYKIEGTPTIVVADNYIVKPAQPQRLIEVTSALVKMVNGGK